MRIEARPLRFLVVHAVRDASQKRLVPAVLVLSLLSLFVMDSCSSCNTNIVVQGEATTVDLSSFAGVLMFGLLSVWSISLAGLLAADHLREIFEDGSAFLWLSRPISRPTLALGRLLGSLIISLGAALILCGGASFFLSVRGNLPLAPALLATLSVLVSCASIAALSMLSSLFVPRVVNFLLVFGAVGSISVLNLATVGGRSISGLFFVLDQFGPPLMTAIVAALVPWWSSSSVVIPFWDIVIRSFIWFFGSIVLLLVVFDQSELSRFENR